MTFKKNYLYYSLTIILSLFFLLGSSAAYSVTESDDEAVEKDSSFIPQKKIEDNLQVKGVSDSDQNGPFSNDEEVLNEFSTTIRFTCAEGTEKTVEIGQGCACMSGDWVCCDDWEMTLECQNGQWVGKKNSAMCGSDFTYVEYDSETCNGA